MRHAREGVGDEQPRAAMPPAPVPVPAHVPHRSNGGSLRARPPPHMVRRAESGGDGDATPSPKNAHNGGRPGLPPAMPKVPELEGYLWKLKSKQGFLANATGSWNKRWFCVDRGTSKLLYYRRRPKRSVNEGFTTSPSLRRIHGKKKFRNKPYFGEAPPTPSGSLKLRDVSVVEHFDAAEGLAGCRFQILSAERTFFLRAFLSLFCALFE